MLGGHLHGGGHADAGALLPWLALVGLVGLAAGGQRWAVLRRRRRTGRSWSRWRTASWTGGVLLVAVALSPPLSALAHADPRGHMAQHLLVGMLAPLALVLSAPVTLLLGAASGPVRRRTGAVLGSRAVHVLSHPVTAGLLSTGGLWVLYLTPLHAAAARSPVVHAAVTAHLLVAGAAFAWAVAGPDPAPRRPGTRVRVAALVLSAAAHAVLAKVLFTRAGSGDAWAGRDAAAAEQAAQLMYYGGDVAELLLAAALFAAPHRRGRRSPRPGVAPGTGGLPGAAG